MRELALKEVALRVGKKVADEVMPKTRSKRGVAKLVVCVSSNNATQQHIIRKAARMADIHGAELVALYVQTSDENSDSISLDTQRHLISHLELVVELGGIVKKVVSDNVAQTIANFCREQRATMLCMGQPSLSIPRLLFRVGSYRKLLSKLKEMSVDLIIFA